jgi:hypothetical protein
MVEVGGSREFLIGYTKSVLILYLNRDRGIFNSIIIKEREKGEGERPNYLQSCLLNGVDPSLLEARTQQ